jgi:hypothetical protein
MRDGFDDLDDFDDGDGEPDKFGLSWSPVPPPSPGIARRQGPRVVALAGITVVAAAVGFGVARAAMDGRTASPVAASSSSGPTPSSLAVPSPALSSPAAPAPAASGPALSSPAAPAPAASGPAPLGSATPGRTGSIPAPLIPARPGGGTPTPLSPDNDSGATPSASPGQGPGSRHGQDPRHRHRIQFGIGGRVTAVSATSITLSSNWWQVTAAITRTTTVTGQVQSISGIKVGDLVFAQITEIGGKLTADAIRDSASMP